jgi:SAM-dependent methyltransferase
MLGARSVLGIDISAGLLHEAERAHGCDKIRFRLLEDFRPKGEIDLVFCNGVFHHIPPALRAETIDWISRALRPHGLFALWENNPWNPGTRFIMRRIPFDRDAFTLSAPEARRLVSRGGFGVLRMDFMFIFPRILRWCRRVEPYLSCLPLGAQYQVLCQNRS